MRFEVKILDSEVWVFRAAGLETDAYQQLLHQVLVRKVKLPAVVNCRYFLSDTPVEVQITVLPLGHFQIEVADPEIGKSIQAEIQCFSAKTRGTPLAEQEHRALYARIGKILEPDGVTPDDVEAGRVVLSRRAQEGLMLLCDEVHHTSRGNVYWQFVKCQIPRPDRAFVAHWLLQRFAVEKDPCVRSDIDTVFLNHNDLALRELAEDLVRLIRNPRYGVSRSGLVHVLAKTKYPGAADVIASVMDEDQLAWSALRALGSLRATQYADHIRKYLRHPDSELRLEAKRTLKKIGLPVEIPPPPIHLLKPRRLLPKGLEEWSANLDFEQLEPVLSTLSRCINQGFGAEQIAEVMGVAEETRPEQTKTFRFPITANGRNSELWLVIFMDDINSPDLAIHGDPELIKHFETTVDLED